MHRLAAFLTIALFATAAHADSNRPPHSLFLRNTFVGRVNPVGLIDFAQISYRRRLYVEEEAALADNFVGIGLVPTLSPAFGRIGPIVEFQPATVLSLWASYEVFRYFGSFNFLQSFPSVNSDFSDTELDRRGELPKGDPLRNYAATGTQLNLGANAQIKVGPIAVRNLFRMFRPDYDARSGDRVVYDIVYDVLAPNGGWVVNNDLDVLYVTKGGLSAGVRWTSNFAYYQAKHYLPGEDTGREPNTPMHRLGPLVAYSFWKDRGGAFDNPTLLLIANWWLEHRYRTGADVSRGLPYLVFGFQFTGDLLPHPPQPERLLNGLPKEEIPVAPLSTDAASSSR